MWQALSCYCQKYTKANCVDVYVYIDIYMNDIVNFWWTSLLLLSTYYLPLLKRGWKFKLILGSFSYSILKFQSITIKLLS